ncbi:hypothetical protein ACTXQV_81760, partial [Klebsiella pneumoniae]
GRWRPAAVYTMARFSRYGHLAVAGTPLIGANEWPDLPDFRARVLASGDSIESERDDGDQRRRDSLNNA